MIFIYGDDGIDTIDGGLGNDRIIWRCWQRYLSGSLGNDRITGGLGRDKIGGGAGSDIFVFANLIDSTTKLSDVILDFHQEKSRIKLMYLFEFWFNFKIRWRQRFTILFFRNQTIVKDQNSFLFLN